MTSLWFVTSMTRMDSANANNLHEPVVTAELSERDQLVLEFERHWWKYAGAKVPGWSRDFDLWAAEALRSGDVDTLASYRDRAPGMPYAHPTVEHYTPLFVALGAGTDLTTPA